MKKTKSLTMLKKAFIFIFLFISVLTIVACRDGGDDPMGSINNEVFINIGNHSVTNRQLYEALRPNSTSILRDLIERELFAEEIAQINLDFAGIDENHPEFENIRRQRTEIQRQINSSIFGQTTVEDILGMHEQNRARMILSFADSIAVASSVNRESLLTFIETALVRWENDQTDLDLEGNPITECEFYDFGWLNDETIADLKDSFVVSLAQWNWARSILEELVIDETEDLYISETDLVNIFRSQFENRHDVAALVVAFQSTAEHQIAAQRWQVKSNARGQWFQLPDIFSEESFNQLMIIDGRYRDESDNFELNTTLNGLHYAWELLNDLIPFNEPVIEGDGTVTMTPIDFERFQQFVHYTSQVYQTFHNRWILSTNREVFPELPLFDISNDELTPGANLAANEVLLLFAAMYDDLNVRTEGRGRFTQIAVDANGNLTDHTIEGISWLPNVDPATWINADGSWNSNAPEGLFFTHNHSTFNRNTQLRNEVYALTNNIYTGDFRFSRTPNNLGGGSAFFLIFGLWADPVSRLELVDETDEDAPVLNVDATPVGDETAEEAQARAAAATEARQDSWDFLFNQRLTQTFINNRVNERLEETDIYIYDSIIRLFFNHESGTEHGGRNGDRGNDVVASVDGRNIYVDTLFNDLKDILGLSSAFDIILLEILSERYEDQITGDEIEAMKTQFNATLTSFRNNQLAGAGFPASIGMDDFLMLAFQSTNNHEAFRRGHILPRLRTLFAEDLTAHYGTDTAGGNIFARFAELAHIQYQNNIGVTTSHVLIYIDINQDGSPDNPNDFTEEDLIALGFTPSAAQIADPTLPGVTDTSKESMFALMQYTANELQQIISRLASVRRLDANSLQAVIERFERATRFGDIFFNHTDPEFDTWVRFRRHGFGLRMEELGVITNTTNNPDTQGGFDVDFFEHTMDIAAALSDVLGDEPTASDRSSFLPFWAPTSGIPGFTFDIDNARSAFGWHLLLVTDIQTRLSAQLERPTGDLDTRFVSSVVNPWPEVEGETYLNAYNEERFLSRSQIQIFIEESRLETGVETLSTAMTNAIARYFAPVQMLFNSAPNQLELAFRVLAQVADSTIAGGFLPNLNNPALNARAELLRDVNVNTLFSYGIFFNFEAGGRPRTTSELSLFQQQAQVQRFVDQFGQWFVILTR